MLNALVGEFFEHPDTAVIRMGYVEGRSGFHRLAPHRGKLIAPRISGLKISVGDVYPKPRTAGNLLYGFLRRPLIQTGGFDAVDDTTKLGKAVVSVEQATGLTIVGITHVDDRYDPNRGACNDISLVTDPESDGLAMLRAVWDGAMTNPAEFVESMHTRLGQGFPAELQIGAFATYRSSRRQYDIVPVA